MELVLAILAALIIFNWFQTGEIWQVLGGLAFLVGIGLLLLALLNMTANFAQEFFGVILGGGLCWGAIIGVARMVRWLLQKRRTPSRPPARAYFPRSGASS